MPENKNIDIDKISSQSTTAQTGVLPKARTDLEITEQVYYGKPCFVLKDPTTLRYYRLRPPEYTIFKMLDGKTTLDEVLKALATRFPDDTFDAQSVMSFIIMMRGGNLLQSTGDNTTDYLMKRKKQLSRSIWQRIKTEYMFFKIPLLDPDKLLAKLDRMIGSIIFSKSMIMLTLVLFVFAMFMLFSNIDNLGQRQPLLSWTNLMFLFPALFCIKIIHEFGHGLTAKHFGIEVHEMGILFLVFMPCMYCDVSDAWMLSKKHRRVWITAAGIAVEVFLATVATIIWSITIPGSMINQFALNIMLAASINTIMFNGNPLLRYDGYYFVMDMLEIPNMKQKATQYLWYLGKKYVLGMEKAEKPIDLDTRESGIFTYAICSAIYRWFIIFAIITMIWKFLAPYGLESIAGILALSTIFTSFISPIIKFTKFLANQWDSIHIHPLMATLIILLVCSSVILVLLIPIEQSIDTQCVIRPADLTPLYVSRPGFLELNSNTNQKLFDGMPVKAGDLLVRLSDPELSYKVNDLEFQKRQKQIALNQARNIGKAVEEKQIIEELKAIELYLERAKSEKSRLDIISPIDGMIVLNPQIQLNRFEGKYIQNGTELLSVCKKDSFEAIAAVKAQDMEFIKDGLQVDMKLWSLDSKTVKSNVMKKNIPETKVQILSSLAFSTMYQGDIPTIPSTDQEDILKPAVNVYEVKLPISLADSVGLRDGQTGRVRIIYEDKTLGQTFMSWLYRTLRLDLGI